jgi:hypothetical protein
MTEADVVGRALSMHTNQSMVGGQGSSAIDAEQTAAATSGDSRVQVSQTMQFGGGHQRELTQNVNVNTADRDYFFPATVWEQERRVKQVEAGKTYEVKIACSLNPPQGIQAEPVKISSRKLSLRLEVEPPDAAFINTSDGAICLSDNPAEWAHVFEVKIRDECPQAEISFHVTYDVGAGAFNQATTIPIRLVDEPKVSPKGVALNVDFRAPAELLTIHLNRLNSESIEIVGPEGRKATLRSAQANFDGVNSLGTYLERMQQSGLPGTEAGLDRVTQWFENLIAMHADSATIMVLDGVGVQVAWELLRLPKNRYLGAHAAVVRWTVNEAAEQIHKARVRGRVREFAGAELELESIDDIQIGASSKEIGIIYLNCDAVVHTMAHGSQPRCPWMNPGAKMRRLPLEDYCSPCEQFVFADTPHSAHVQDGGDGPVGLPITILKLFQGGFIGTLAPMGSISRDVFESLKQRAVLTGGVNPPEFLKDLRRQAEQVLQGLATVDDKLERARRKEKALSTFAYVYYGPPSLQLEVCE